MYDFPDELIDIFLWDKGLYMHYLAVVSMIF